MRVRLWLGAGLLALACGGSTAKPGSSGGQAGHSTLAGSGGAPGSAGGDAPAMAGKGAHAGGAAPGGAGATAGEPAVVAGAGAGGEAGSPPDTFDASCPATLPRVSAGCESGLRCDYGVELRPWCRPRADCLDGSWSLTLPRCAALQLCTTLVNFNDNGDCSPEAAPEACEYEAHLCRCGPPGPSPRWQCAGDIAASICPDIVPNEGQACAIEPSIDCYYQPCVGLPPGESGVFVAICDGRTWRYKETCGP